MNSTLYTFFTRSLMLGLLTALAPGGLGIPSTLSGEAAGVLGRSPGFDSPLLLPDLQALPPADLEVQLEDGDGRKNLRLTVSVANRGTGALELLGVSDPRAGITSVTQHIFTFDGQLLEFPVGSFVFHPSHGHWHLENFARYEVMSLTYSGTLKSVLAQNDKVSFCLRDLDHDTLEENPASAAYTACGKQMQGLSLGWTDTYRYHLAGQYIDITGVPDGFYAVRVTFDPEDLLLEGREDNNSEHVYIQITGNDLRMIDNSDQFRILLDPRKE
ncbi:MAG: lysyl oxidase family protein [Anaerolineales bacterium]|nr:lysyl oxidase family protein [Anaerolineales bacterium]